MRNIFFWLDYYFINKKKNYLLEYNTDIENIIFFFIVDEYFILIY